MMGMIGHTLVALVDNIMVGQLGTAELAAVSLGNSFMFIAMSLGIGFSTAITPLIAESAGEDNFIKGKSTYKHGLILCFSLGIVLFLAILLAKPLLYGMNQPPEVVVLAIPYLDLVAFSLIPLIIFQALKQFSEGLSLTEYPMYATLVANVFNILLNYVLIFGNWGFPEMGIIGAAIGTVVSRFIMLFFLWYVLRSKEKSKGYVSELKIYQWEGFMLKKIISQGFPSALQMFFEVGIFTSAVWLSGILGKNPQAANQIALNIASITFMVAMGLSAAAMIRVGHQKGLKQFKELKRITYSILLLTFFVEIIFAIVFVIFHKVLPELYLDMDDITNAADNTEVVLIASQLILIAALFQLSDGIQVVVLGALRGIQDVKIPTAITFIAYWVVGFPLSYYLSLHTNYGNSGIWIGLLAGLTVSAILLFIRFQYVSKKIDRRNINFKIVQSRIKQSFFPFKTKYLRFLKNLSIDYEKAQ